MKKIITTLALIATLGIAFTASNAMAWGHGYGRGGNGMMTGYGMGNGSGMGPGMMQGYGSNGYGNGMGPGMMNGNTPVDNEAYQKFLDETADLRTGLAGDRAELRAVMAGTNPDPARVRTLTETIIEKQTKLNATARENNIAPMGFGRGQFCDGTGPRNGFGRHHGRNW